jgi:3-deoxy-D-manno-octulosonate 8-phosphate phosphatase (KDO 8-P phosphatase)
VAIITGRKAKLVEDRCQTLGITHLYQGQSDKLGVPRLLGKLACAGKVAYVGDDLIDWPVMAEVGLASPLPMRIRCCSRARLTLPTSTADAARYVKSAICYCWRRASLMRPKGNQYE